MKNNPGNEMIAKIRNEINTHLIEWEGLSPATGPQIPRVKRNTIKYIETINNTTTNNAKL